VGICTIKEEDTTNGGTHEMATMRWTVIFEKVGDNGSSPTNTFPYPRSNDEKVLLKARACSPVPFLVYRCFDEK